MRYLRALLLAPAWPRILDPSELSPHLLRDIGLWDGPSSAARSTSSCIGDRPSLPG
jgi:hypothetical protein